MKGAHVYALSHLLERRLCSEIFPEVFYCLFNALVVGVLLSCHELVVKSKIRCGHIIDHPNLAEFSKNYKILLLV